MKNRNRRGGEKKKYLKNRMRRRRGEQKIDHKIRGQLVIMLYRESLGREKTKKTREKKGK